MPDLPGHLVQRLPDAAEQPGQHLGPPGPDLRGVLVDPSAVGPRPVRLPGHPAVQGEVVGAEGLVVEHQFGEGDLVRLVPQRQLAGQLDEPVTDRTLVQRGGRGQIPRRFTVGTPSGDRRVALDPGRHEGVDQQVDPAWRAIRHGAEFRDGAGEVVGAGLGSDLGMGRPVEGGPLHAARGQMDSVGTGRVQLAAQCVPVLRVDDVLDAETDRLQAGAGGLRLGLDGDPRGSGAVGLLVARPRGQVDPEVRRPGTGQGQLRGERALRRGCDALHCPPGRAVGVALLDLDRPLPRDRLGGSGQGDRAAGDHRGAVHRERDLLAPGGGVGGRGPEQECAREEPDAGQPPDHPAGSGSGGGCAVSGRARHTLSLRWVGGVGTIPAPTRSREFEDPGTARVAAVIARGGRHTG